MPSAIATTATEAPQATLAASRGKPPLWHLDAVFYEVPVKAFFDADGNGVGDFRGLTRKLGYIRDLGASCLWLLPFHPSPLKDDGFDVADYRGVHPALGTIDDFRRFLDEAHRLGLRVVAEMAVNHTSDRHPWFQAARTAPPGSELRRFYLWDAAPFDRGGDRNHWTWDAKARSYYFHRFSACEPDLNYRHAGVRDEMRKVLSFWLDLGLDGLCLNGASVLDDGDGRLAEDLPGTHDVLRGFRQMLEADYPGRILQAGLNAPPDRASQYLGDGGCHVAPNLALTERLFLALAREERHPLVSLLEGMPAIPESCQWALFLRNHDELTPGPDVDDDTLLEAYAAEPHLRYRAGILRRLAPLLDNDRRRIELMFGLLFSLPGAPVVYYGDELGIGDNPFLGHRDALRAPMPWTGDRNGGFSTADTARLYAPPLTDPVYGYAAVNVESSQRDSSSLFHWVRRTIALRRRHEAFARGSFEFIDSDNPRTLAFVRQLGESRILVVANLSRSAQPLDLDLSAHRGLIPVEMRGRTPFPRITGASYRLTLAPHGIFWLELKPEVSEIASRRAPVPTEPISQIPVIEWSGERGALFEDGVKDRLEREVLPSYLRSQRWFGGKARNIERVELQVAGSGIGDPGTPVIAFAGVTFDDGRVENYFLPLAVAEGVAAGPLLERHPQAVIARLRRGSHESILHDALAGESAVRVLVDLVGGDGAASVEGAAIRGSRTACFAELRGPGDRTLTVTPGPATSSNSLVFVGRRLLLKAFRRVETGLNPDIEIGSFLTERNLFDRTPRVAGRLEIETPRGTAILGILQEKIANQGDGWKQAIEELGRYYDRASARMFGPPLAEPDPRPLLELAESAPPLSLLEAIGEFRQRAALLGRRTAELHLALSRSDDEPAFAAEPLTGEKLDRLREDLATQARAALDTLADRQSTLPDAIAGQANSLLERRARLDDELRALVPFEATGGCLRVHGDFHLGQVLAVDDDYVILDFEGEPTRSLEARREKQSPLKDVAGMIRSYHYAAYAGLFSWTHDRPDDFPRLEPWAGGWYRVIAAAFLHEYLRTAGEARFLPQDHHELARLLEAFLLEKAFYELSYELGNRPDWVRIPLHGVLDLLPH